MNILVADDHELVRNGLILLLRRLIPGADVSEASSCRELEKMLGNGTVWDLILLDLIMPGAEKLHIIQLVRDIAPSVPVVVVSADEDSRTIRKVLDLGARGYIPKSVSGDIMVNALQLILAGGRYLPDNLLYCVEPESSSETLAGMTPRQTVVALMLTEGKSNKEIGRALDMSEATVRTHLTAIFRALNVHSRTQALIAISKMV